jgi:hypothetical protein
MLRAPPAQAETRAQTRAASAAFVVGASLFLAGFTVGSVLLATSHSDDGQNNAGWLSIDAGFALAPLASHAVSQEWTRALLFAAVPSACLAGTATLVAIHPATIDHGELEDQRVIWSLFGVGLFSSLVGVVDSAFADQRATSATLRRSPIAVAPLLGPGRLGLALGAAL